MESISHCEWSGAIPVRADAGMSHLRAGSHTSCLQTGTCMASDVLCALQLLSPQHQGEDDLHLSSHILSQLTGKSKEIVSSVWPFTSVTSFILPSLALNPRPLAHEVHSLHSLYSGWELLLCSKPQPSYWEVGCRVNSSGFKYCLHLMLAMLYLSISQWGVIALVFLIIQLGGFSEKKKW